MPIYRVNTSYGFAGTDETILVKSGLSIDEIEENMMEEMQQNLSCYAEEIDPDDLQDWEIESMEDWT